MATNPTLTEQLKWLAHGLSFPAAMTSLAMACIRCLDGLSHTGWIFTPAAMPLFASFFAFFAVRYVTREGTSPAPPMSAKVAAGQGHGLVVARFRGYFREIADSLLR